MSASASLHFPWQRSTRSDWAVSRLADRHYSRQTIGARQFSPPGMNLTLKVGDGDVALAGWVWWHPHRNAPVGRWDGWDGWINCSFFRNEGSGYLSSALVRAAVWCCLSMWSYAGMAVPISGFDTYVMPTAIRSSNPGWCYQCAGWTVTDNWTRDGKKRRLILPLNEVAL